MHACPLLVPVGLTAVPMPVRRVGRFASSVSAPRRLADAFGLADHVMTVEPPIRRRRGREHDNEVTKSPAPWAAAVSAYGDIASVALYLLSDLADEAEEDTGRHDTEQIYAAMMAAAATDRPWRC